jgi:uncharacterized protein (DUF58 family)
MRLTRSGVAVAAGTLLLLAGAWLADYPELGVLALGGLAVLLLAVAWMLLGRAALPANRELRPARVSVGEPARAVISVSNRGRFRSPPAVVTESVRGHRMPVAVPSLGRGQQHRVEYRLPTDRRGVCPIGPLTIGNSDPFRLLRAGAQAAGTDVLRVYPTIHPVQVVHSGLAHDLDGPTSVGAAQGGVAFHSLREYVPGDDWRLIHWPTTARVGTVMVRHNVAPAMSSLRVVLDTGHGPYTVDTFEEAVSAAASLCVAAARGGVPLDVRTTGGRQTRFDHGATRAATALTPLLDLFTEVEWGAVGAPDLTAAVRPTGPSDAGTAMAVFTGQTAPDLLAAVGAVGGRFLTTSLIQFTGGARAGPPLRSPSGVSSVTVSSAAEFAAGWGQALR